MGEEIVARCARFTRSKWSEDAFVSKRSAFDANARVRSRRIAAKEGKGGAKYRTRHHDFIFVVVCAVCRSRSAHFPIHNHLNHLLIPVTYGDILLVVRKRQIHNLDACHLGSPSESVGLEDTDRTAVQKNLLGREDDISVLVTVRNCHLLAGPQDLDELQGMIF